MTENSHITLGVYCDKINEALKRLTADKPYLRENICEAMEYSLLAGGKRLRPVLMLEFCRMCGGDADKFADVACSIECIHTFSLIHDDLPCMDDDDFRRGRPSCHKQFGEATALLAGDALNTLAFEIIADAAMSEIIPAQTAVMLTSVLSKAVGVSGMIGGQIIDLAAENREISIEELDLLQRHKTGALIEAACVMGVILAGRYDMIPAAAQYADALGRAFQIVDDILDVTGTFEELGKPIGSDSEQNKSTYVTALGIEGAQKEADRLTEQALIVLKQFEDCEFLADLTDSLLHRRS
ncbi:geranylgeranyl diphosphate synthase, type II [Ruminococcus sp. YE71]|uniref:polyprenyl synthetase family protein n=1 Tax=unclassified Ruminococcus TaxID=2608920 RepID=UPI000882C817|nr:MULTISPECIES: farnesyl diphosphate synthase [unclassified Ruminococcus]SDA17019.1 geranylgeranyl diphosphate synthase, type II [Ruminococcus sp. YE78]SFW25938.1 geranylgeranyl diphosphate synthase, type II [Ruminococcus sp. YE71]